MRIKFEIKSIFLLILTTFVANAAAQKNLYLQYQWKYLDFQFPSAAIRDAAIRNRVYIKGNSFPIDIDVYNGGFMTKLLNFFISFWIQNEKNIFYSASGTLHFVTMPRFFDGTPITLGTITGTTVDGGPLIAPFPDYSWHQSGNCNGFTSVFRVFVSFSRAINGSRIVVTVVIIFSNNR